MIRAWLRRLFRRAPPSGPRDLTLFLRLLADVREAHPRAALRYDLGVTLYDEPCAYVDSSPPERAALAALDDLAARAVAAGYEATATAVGLCVSVRGRR